MSRFTTLISGFLNRSHQRLPENSSTVRVSDSSYHADALEHSHSDSERKTIPSSVGLPPPAATGETARPNSIAPPGYTESPLWEHVTTLSSGIDRFQTCALQFDSVVKRDSEAFSGVMKNATEVFLRPDDSIKDIDATAVWEFIQKCNKFIAASSGELRHSNLVAFTSFLAAYVSSFSKVDGLAIKDEVVDLCMHLASLDKIPPAAKGNLYSAIERLFSVPNWQERLARHADVSDAVNKMASSAAKYTRKEDQETVLSALTALHAVLNNHMCYEKTQLEHFDIARNVLVALHNHGDNAQIRLKAKDIIEVFNRNSETISDSPELNQLMCACHCNFIFHSALQTTGQRAYSELNETYNFLAKMPTSGLGGQKVPKKALIECLLSMEGWPEDSVKSSESPRIREARTSAIATVISKNAQHLTGPERSSLLELSIAYTSLQATQAGAEIGHCMPGLTGIFELLKARPKMVLDESSQTRYAQSMNEIGKKFAAESSGGDMIRNIVSLLA